MLEYPSEPAIDQKLKRAQSLVGYSAMFETLPLKKVWVFSKRLTMSKGGEKTKNSGMLAFAWFVFEHDYDGEPTIGWI
jgi:hypothetical protein